MIRSQRGRNATSPRASKSREARPRDDAPRDAGWEALQCWIPKRDSVPPGATTTDAIKEPYTQFCSSPGVLQYYSISFEQEALVHSCPLMGGLFYMLLNSLVDSDVLDLGASGGRRVIFLTLAVGFTLCGHVVCI